MSFIAGMFESIAKFVASTSTLLCAILFFDEPRMPDEMIK